MLWRFAGEPKADIQKLSDFVDGDIVSEYAKVAVAWAVEKGILTGKGEKQLDPQGTAQRAEAAAMFMRLNQA